VLGLLVAAALLAPTGAEELLRLPAPVAESSGVASSSRADDLLFTHNDSGDEGRFYAVSLAGELRATYVLPGVQARDWEDMARGPDARGDSSLWLGDIGDNSAARDRGLLVHRVPEPDPAATGTVETPPTSFRLRYDDGPRDAEALLVHPRTGRLYVISKEVFRRPGVYAAPERLDPDGPNPLRRIGELDLPRTTTDGGPDLGGAVRALVTSGDIAPDGSRLAVRTYTDLYEWRLTGSDLAAAFGSEPSVTALPPTVQGEGLAYTSDGTAVLLTSEGAGAPVHRVPVSAADAAPPEPPGTVVGPPFVEDRAVPWSVLALAGALGLGVLVVVAARRARR
jgi:hypothetical protein